MSYEVMMVSNNLGFEVYQGTFVLADSDYHLLY